VEPGSSLPGAVVPAFKDRRTTLIIAGIVQLLMGALSALLLPLMLFGQAMASRMNGGETQYRLILPGIAFYGILAAVFITLGIGSIRERRWARALSLILAWSWLLVGVLSLGMYAVILPKVFMSGAPGMQALPESARVMAVVLAVSTMGFFFVLVPGALVFMYRSKHVKATCDARDPVVRWTDRCPLPVLGLSVWLFFGGVTMLMMPVLYRGVAPFFGILISGFPGAVYYLVLAGLFLYLSRALYKLSLVAWWIALLLIFLFGVSSLLTFGQVDLMEMYRLMGYPEAQIAQLQQFSFLQGAMVWATALCFLPLFGYLFYVRKFFRREAPPLNANIS
jgi:hypothetical protein